MKKLLLILLVAFQAQAFASSDVCVTIDTSGWSQEKINLMQAVAYELAVDAGQNNFPSRNKNELCFMDPTFDVQVVITKEAISDRYDRDEADRQAIIQAELEKDAEAEDELKLNDVSKESLKTIDAKVNAVSDLDQMKAYVKELSRLVLAKHEVES